MHNETLRILRDLVDWVNELKAERYGHRDLGGVEEQEYLRLQKTLDEANRHRVILQRALEDERKTVF